MSPDRLKRILLSLADGPLRVEWLRAELEHMSAADAAVLVNAVVEESEALDPRAREALLTIALVFTDSNNVSFADRMRRETVVEDRLFGLRRLLRRAPPTSVRPQKPDEERVPQYEKGRELTLGERKSLARRPDRKAFDKLILDPHPLVIRQLLENPKMIEDDAIRLAARRPASVSAVQELARSYRFMSRPRVRMAIVQNPGSPPEIAIPLLGLCNREELRDILKSTETSLALRATAQELLARNPPTPSETPPTLH
jgi:hypothetical protein